MDISDAGKQRVPWGKFDRASGAVHHLAHHMADVAAVFEALCRLPVIRARLETAAGRPLSNIDLARLAVIVFLHDAGKLHPGFQAKAWPPGMWKEALHGHVKEGAAIFKAKVQHGRLREILGFLFRAEIKSWDRNLELLNVSFAHHGRPFGDPDSIAFEHWFKPCQNGYDPAAAAETIGKLLPLWFPLAFSEGSESLPDAADFCHLFCGLVSLADWLGSEKSVFTFAGPLEQNYMDDARQKAMAAVAGVRLDTRDLQRLIAGRSGFADLTGFAAPNGQQAMIGGCPLDERLLILEAETGSGKTEAALWRFAKLLEAGLVDSLYFAVPTRAAAKQLQRRVQNCLNRVFATVAPEAVLAIPGYRVAGETSGQPLPDFKVLWDDDPDRERQLARWAAENAKRHLAAPVAVGTVDQAMLCALQVKHAHLRAAALCRSLLVIDEVHASDHYMREIQHRLLKTHLGRGGHALLMSATLGSVARAKWLGRKQPTFEDAVAAPYPALWSLQNDTPRSAQAQGRNKSVAMTAVATMDPARTAQLATAAACRNARVLVIRNTVDVAVATWQAVRDAGAEALLMTVAGGPALHHSRFAPEDRALLDEAVEDHLNKARGSSDIKGVIVIGTQTLEQSLDIDADLLITDLCPIDVLLQRIGRLHRHDLKRPAGFEQAACHVLVPEQGLEPLLKPAFENGLGGWKASGGAFEAVYGDLAMIELTRRLIVDHPVWHIPSMNRFLVESATHPDKIEALIKSCGPQWSEYQINVYAKECAAAGAARNVFLDTTIEFSEVQFPSDDENIRTRLGEEGTAVTFTAPVTSPLGKQILNFTLPSHWSKGVDSRDPVHAEALTSGGITFTVGHAQFLYHREGLTKCRQ